MTVTAANTGLSQGTLTIATTAVNAPTQTASLEAYSENNLCRTATAITLNPATGVSYPGSTSVSATVTALDPTCSPGNSPNGGKISLTLAPQTKGAAQIVLNSTLSNGTATFNRNGTERRHLRRLRQLSRRPDLRRKLELEDLHLHGGAGRVHHRIVGARRA